MPRYPKYLFSYGSNSPRQLQERLGHSVTGRSAYAPGWKRVFRGYSYGWDGGVASMERDADYTTFGFVAPVSMRDLYLLDRYEGVESDNYRRHIIEVVTSDGERLKAVAYLATSREFNEPSEAYLDAVTETIGQFWREPDGAKVTKKDIPVRNPRGPYISLGVLYLPEPDPDGRTEVPVKQIGKGAFTRAYLTKTGEPYVYLKTHEERGGDYSKRQLSELNRDGEHSPYIPRLVSLDCDAQGFCYYRMPYYNAPLRKGDSEKAWKQYRMIRKVWDAAQHELQKRINKEYRQKGSSYGALHTGDMVMNDVVEGVEEAGGSEGLVRALSLLRDQAGNYGSDYTFEFSPRNLATNDSGQLILLDTVFSLLENRRRLDEANRKRRGY